MTIDGGETFYESGNVVKCQNLARSQTSITCRYRLVAKQSDENNLINIIKNNQRSLIVERGTNKNCATQLHDYIIKQHIRVNDEKIYKTAVE